MRATKHKKWENFEWEIYNKSFHNNIISERIFNWEIKYNNPLHEFSASSEVGYDSTILIVCVKSYIIPFNDIIGIAYNFLSTLLHNNAIEHSLVLALHLLYVSLFPMLHIWIYTKLNMQKGWLIH